MTQGIEKPKRHRSNVEGPFYVVDGCCTTCGVPMALASDLFAEDSDGHCYVQRQPTTPEQLERALRVVRTQELGCIRYGGADPRIRHRLAEAGEAAQCDLAPPADVGEVNRNCVSFDFGWGESDVKPMRILADLEQKLGAGKYRFTPIIEAGAGAQLSLSWYKNDFHKVMVSKIADSHSRWLLRHSGPLGLSEEIDDWLRDRSDSYRDVRWFSEEELRRADDGRERPW